MSTMTYTPLERSTGVGHGEGVRYVDATASPVPAPADLRQYAESRPRGGLPDLPAGPSLQPQNAADHPRSPGHVLSAAAPGAAAVPLAGGDPPDPCRCGCLA